MSATWLAAPAVTGLVTLTESTTPDASQVKPGWVAFAIVVALCVVTTLLWLNMRKQLGKIRFEEKDTQRRRSSDQPPVE